MPGATLSVMDTVDAALSVIIRRVPTLAAEAAKAKARGNERLKAKAASRIAAEAVASSVYADLSAADRKAIAAAIEAVRDNTLSATLPPVRITSDQMRQLEGEAERADMSLSELIRWRLFDGR